MGLVQPPVLPTDEIQGDIIPGFQSRGDVDFAQHFMLLRVVKRDRARAELKALLPELTTAADTVLPAGGQAPPTSTNIGFTFTGLCELAPDAGLAGAFAHHDAFKTGLAQRSSQQVQFENGAARFDLLGRPARWGLVDGASAAGKARRFVRAALRLARRRHEPKVVHAVLNLGGRAEGRLAAHVAAIAPRIAGGFEVVGEQACSLPAGRQTDVFGFADGLSQPLVEGFHEPRRDRARPVAADRFLLRDDNPITANGSFMVWVRFTQDRNKFEAHCDDVARRLRQSGYREAGTGDVVSALEVGRWKDGTALAHCPVVGSRHVHDSGELFDYAEDFFGRGCPRHAHIRKMNPRTEGAREHAILRRGIPFQDGDEQGLIFVCYQASIEQQYEQLQGYWANAAYAPEPNASPDPLISQQARRRTVVEVPLPGGGSVPVTVVNDWITPTAGFYAFVPSLSGLRHLLRDG
jgi:Dyp-type peroxidase family